MIGFELKDGVSMRLWRESDAELVFEAVKRNYDHLATFMEWIKPDHSLDDYRKFVKREMAAVRANTGLGFGIFREDRLLGTAGLASLDHAAKVTEIGYWIDREEEGKAIISRAVAKLIDYAFTELGMNRIQIRCATANVRSAAISQRFGFMLEGVQRQHVLRNGILYDFAIYGLLAAEWKGNNGK